MLVKTKWCKRHPALCAALFPCPELPLLRHLWNLPWNSRNLCTVYSFTTPIFELRFSRTNSVLLVLKILNLVKMGDWLSLKEFFISEYKHFCLRDKRRPYYKKYSKISKYTNRRACPHPLRHEEIRGREIKAPQIIELGIKRCADQLQG